MSELNMITFCQFLANITHNRCHLVENSNTCRCVGDIINPMSPRVTSSAAPDIMSSEIFLIFFVLAIWLSAIGFCLNQYKSLRRLETQVHYCVSRKDPLNIGEIKIVTREQDSIIYKKKRYSTLIDTHINPEALKNIGYVQQYLPKNPMKPISSTLSNSAPNQCDLIDNSQISTIIGCNSSNNTLLNTCQEVEECPPTVITHFKSDVESNNYMEKVSNVRPKVTAGLTIPHISSPSSLRSSWNDSHLCEANSLTQHLSVPSNSLRSNRLSEGNISLPVPRGRENYTDNSNEKLLDPRLIPETVRRSLLALHRESQENIDVLKKKTKTRSENDVNGSFTAWKIKMKSKLKRAHNQQHNIRTHANTVAISSMKYNSNDCDQSIFENVMIHSEYKNVTESFEHHPTSIIPPVRRSLKHYPKYSTQSTTESETTQCDLPSAASIFMSTDDDESAQTVIEKS